MRASYLASTLAIGAVALGVAACGSGNSSNGSSASTAPSSGIVSVDSIGGMKVLASPAGKTLYTASAEQGGKLRCVSTACTSIWSPALATPAAAKQAATQLKTTLGVVTRPDGKQQLTFKSMPLYSFTQEGAKALQGNGFTDDFQGTHFQWQAAATSGGGAAPMSRGGGY